VTNADDGSTIPGVSVVVKGTKNIYKTANIGISLFARNILFWTMSPSDSNLVKNGTTAIL
jgi:hypothetical protein